MTNLVDIARGWVATLNADYNTAQVLAIGNNGTLITVCSTLWITEGNTIEDSGGNQYSVISMVFNESLTVAPLNGAPDFNDSVIIAPEVHYHHGTPSSVNNEYINIEEDQVDKTPIVWLLEPYDEEPLDADSSLDASYNFRMYFLQGLEEESTNDQHNELAQKPMKQLSIFVEDIIANDYNFRRVDGALSRKALPRIGVEVSNRGSDRRLLDAGMSGYSMSVSPLDVYDLTQCKTNC